MAAAYASLNSVMYILQQIRHHPRPPITLENQHMDSLCENISFLQDFLENYSHRDIGCLGSQIADAAYAAEDVIESHIVDQIQAKITFLENNYTNLFCQGVHKITQILSASTSHGQSSSYTIFRQALQNVNRKWDFVPEEMRVKIKHQRPSRESSTTMLGFDEVLSQVMDRLTAQRSNPQILPIIGILSGIALISLVNIRELIHHTACFTSNLGKSICIWESFLRDYTTEDEYGEAQDFLETQIVDAACAAKDIIQSQLVGIIHPQSNNLFYQDLQKVIKDMNLINKEVIKIQEKWRIHDHQMPRDIISMSDNIGSSSRVPPSIRKNANAMVGFDDVLVEIMDGLTGHQPNRQVLPIVGMGGIGKTTLARNVYDHPYIVQHFDNRVWITVSHEYGLRKILVEALFCVHKTYQNHENKSEDELGDQLYKSLCGRRYLIVLDDMWSIEAWEELKFFFPDNKNGSRIMITTRLSNVAKYFGSSGFKMNFLDEDKSWKLLHKIVFAQDQYCCPQELEETGKKIARNCKGLPLSIVVIGGLLANSEMTRQHWEYVAKNLNSMVNLEDDQHCLKILFLSYNQLPIHLKPCFLYMGVYPEDKKIRVSQLIKLWVDEGFLKPIKGKTLEMAAREYFNQLIDWNLILVHKWGSIGNVKVCKMHDILRDLCLKEAQKDKFLWVRRVRDLDNFEGIQIQRRISIHGGTSKEEYQYHHTDRVLKAVTSASLARSLTCNFKGDLSSHCFRLLRVFKVGDLNDRVFKVGDSNTPSLFNYVNTLDDILILFDDRNTPLPDILNPFDYRNTLQDIFKLVNSRYLDFQTVWNFPSIFPSSIHLQWNLRTLIIKGNLSYHNIQVPPEIWEMSQIRNLEIENFSLPDPPNVPLIHEGGDDELILRNLRTYDFHQGWCHNYCLSNLGRLNKLESLCLIFAYGIEKGSYRIEMIQNLAFPHSLKKLTLYDTRMLWEDMRPIGSLPHLQVLKLLHKSFRGLKWNPVEGEFLCLKFLLIELCDDLVYWNANRTHFPCLEQLVLSGLHNLKEIPLDMGQISTFRSIELSYCGDSVVISAKNLLDEQVELGNDDLRVRVLCLKNIELERLATHNFQVRTVFNYHN